MRVFTLLIALVIGLSACSSAPEEPDEVPTETSNQALEETDGDEAAETEEGATDAEATTEESAPEPEASAETAAADVLTNDGTRQVGDITNCPVSGHVFTVAEDSPSIEHDGGTYYVCCPGCVDKFKADPAKFAAAGKAGESVGKPKDQHKSHGGAHDGHKH